MLWGRLTELAGKRASPTGSRAKKDPAPYPRRTGQRSRRVRAGKEIRTVRKSEGSTGLQCREKTCLFAKRRVRQSSLTARLSLSSWPLRIPDPTSKAGVPEAPPHAIFLYRWCSPHTQRTHAALLRMIPALRTLDGS